MTDLSYKQMNIYIYEYMCEMVNVMGIGRKKDVAYLGVQLG